LPASEAAVERFHRLYYDAQLAGGTWADTRWLDVPVGKTPLDLWVHQEIVVETRPELVVETGTFMGGSALFFASLLDLLGGGRVVTIDVEARERRPEHPRISYLHGSSTDAAIVTQVQALAREATRVMVVLDSDHRREHVLDEMRAYGGLVSSGCYLVVEDTNINGHPVMPEFGPGPSEALEAFLAESDDFVVDRSREKFLLSFNPGGFLRRR
jgi:cephalosporin hydroxylase